MTKTTPESLPFIELYRNVPLYTTEYFQQHGGGVSFHTTLPLQEHSPVLVLIKWSSRGEAPSLVFDTPASASSSLCGLLVRRELEEREAS